MEDPKALQFFQEVLAKTKAGRIRWEEAASDSEFFSVLPGGFTIAVRGFRSPYESDVISSYALGLSAQDRELLSVSPDVAGVGLAGLNMLYDLAKRRALHVDEAVDKLLGELAKL